MKTTFMITKNALLLKLGRNYKVVYNPDNIFTFDSPDILVGYDNGLYSIFYLKKFEENNIDLLLRRLSVARLSYPSKMINLLIYSNISFYDKYKDLISRNFHRCLHKDEIGDLEKIIVDKPDYSVKKIDEQIIHLHYSQFNNLFNLILKDQKILQSSNYKQFKFGEKYSGVQSWGKLKKVYPLNSVFEDDRGYVVFKERNKKQSFKENINNLLTFASFSNYSLDNGVPYPVENRNKIILNIDDLPQLPNDPLRNIRALAFMGILPVSVSSDNEINHFFNRMSNGKN